MEFPRMLYRFPSAHRDAPTLQDGKTYDWLVVEGPDALEGAIAAGWHKTPAAAKQAHLDALDAAAQASEAAARTKQIADARALVAELDGAPATRAELEAKATELGLKFDKRTTDRSLGERIDAALSSQLV